jgi:hypothetical protein
MKPSHTATPRYEAKRQAPPPPNPPPPRGAHVVSRPLVAGPRISCDPGARGARARQLAGRGALARARRSGAPQAAGVRLPGPAVGSARSPDTGGGAAARCAPSPTISHGPSGSCAAFDAAAACCCLGGALTAGPPCRPALPTDAHSVRSRRRGGRPYTGAGTAWLPLGPAAGSGATWAPAVGAASADAAAAAPPAAPPPLLPAACGRGTALIGGLEQTVAFSCACARAGRNVGLVAL